MTERIHNHRVMEPAGYRVGWAPEEHRVVLLLGGPGEYVSFGLSVEMAADLARDLAAKAHEVRPKPGRADA